MWREFYTRIRGKLTKTYRLELIDDATLSQSRQLIVKPLTILIAAGLLMLLIVGGTASLVILTPAFHRLIPGYVNVEEFQAEKETMAQRLAYMENEISKWEIYLEGVREAAGVGDSGQAEVRPDPRLLDSLSQRSQQPDAPLPTAEAPVPAPQASPEPPPATSARIQEEKVRVIYVSGNEQNSRLDRPSLLTNLTLPLPGKISKGFLPASAHFGIDIVASDKTPIVSLSDGFVVMAEYTEHNGWVIGVSSRRGSENLVVFYKHNSRLLKPVGAYVKAGEPLAIIGNTGENSTGPHLHLEMWYNGQALDPADYLAF
jgi:murein DD-endopeptidase MepM/ murein hydrolase activator NlpD